MMTIIDDDNPSKMCNDKNIHDLTTKNIHANLVFERNECVLG